MENPTPPARVLVIGLDPYRVPGPTAQHWECVVIGGGVRIEPELLERVINLARQPSPAWRAADEFGEAGGSKTATTTTL